MSVKLKTAVAKLLSKENIASKCSRLKLVDSFRNSLFFTLLKQIVIKVDSIETNLDVLTSREPEIESKSVCRTKKIFHDQQ